jgi:hypothetical protein
MKRTRKPSKPSRPVQSTPPLVYTMCGCQFEVRLDPGTGAKFLVARVAVEQVHAPVHGAGDGPGVARYSQELRPRTDRGGGDVASVPVAAGRVVDGRELRAVRAAHMTHAQFTEIVTEAGDVLTYLLPELRERWAEWQRKQPKGEG